MRETSYQSKTLKKIKDMFPGCFILKNDPSRIQGFPDVIILYKNLWAVLEFKVSNKAKVQPNQKHYIDALGMMSFASFISPENEGEVLRELQRSFGVTRKARVSQS